MESISAFDTYYDLLSSLKNISPITLLSIFFLTMARIVPIILIAPFFGAKTIPASIRIMFSISILAILFPQVIFSTTKEIPLNIFFTAYFLKEIFIGFILGLLVSIPFFVAQSAGGLTNHIRGAQSLMVSDPTTLGKTGPIGIFYNYVLIVIFFSIGGPFFFIEGIGKSFVLIPVDKFFNPNFFRIQMPLWQLLIGIFNYTLAMAIQLAAPAIIGIL